MKQQSNKRWRFALWLLVAAALVVMTAGVIYAAGEELERGAVLSGGSTRSSNGFVMRDVIGLPVAGSDIAPNGAGLCSGFGCDARVKGGPVEPGDDVKLFMPKLRRQTE